VGGFGLPVGTDRGAVRLRRGDLDENKTYNYVNWEGKAECSARVRERDAGLAQLNSETELVSIAERSRASG
jgi:hypothetical protein